MISINPKYPHAVKTESLSDRHKKHHTFTEMGVFITHTPQEILIADNFSEFSQQKGNIYLNNAILPFYHFIITTTENHFKINNLINIIDESIYIQDPIFYQSIESKLSISAFIFEEKMSDIQKIQELLGLFAASENYIPEHEFISLDYLLKSEERNKKILFSILNFLNK